MTGKSNLNDLRENKVTPLIAYARTTPSWASVSHLMGKEDLTQDEGELLRGTLELNGARTYIEDLIAGFAGDACGLIASSGLPSGLRHWLINVAHTSAERTA